MTPNCPRCGSPQTYGIGVVFSLQEFGCSHCRFVFTEADVARLQEERYGR